MPQDQHAGENANDIIRMDAAASYKDRNSAMWAASLLYKKGFMALVWPDGGTPVVVFADEEGKYLSVPLGDAQYLGDAPPALGSKWLAHSAIRVAFGDERRIINFTGDMTEYDNLRQETARAQISGDVNPAMVVNVIEGFARIPEIRREQKNAKEAWVEILTNVRDEWLVESDAALHKADMAMPADEEISEPLPTGAELAFCIENKERWFNRLAFGPDGRQVAAIDSAGTAYIWQWETNIELHRLQHHTFGEPQIDNDVTFSPDGSLLATSGADGTAKVWDIVEEKTIHRLMHPDGLGRMVFSPDGRMLATTCDDSYVRVWNLRTGDLLHRLETLNGTELTALAFDDSGRILAYADIMTVVLWDMFTQGRIDEYELPPGDEQASITDMAISRDNTTLAVGYTDGEVIVWDRLAGEAISAIRHGDNIINAVCISPDGSWIVSAGNDDIVRLWHCRSGREVLSIGDCDGGGIAVSRDGSLLATVNVTQAQVWRLSF